VLADVVGIGRSALLPVHLEAQEVLLGPVLLCYSTSVFEGVGEPLEISLMLVLTYLSVCSRTYALVEPELAPAAHEDTRLRVKRTAPLVLARLLGGVPLAPPAAVGQTSESARS